MSAIQAIADYDALHAGAGKGYIEQKCLELIDQAKPVPLETQLTIF
jgi:hypothetical protein